MKIHRLIVFLFAVAVLLGLATSMFISADYPETVLARFDYARDRTPEYDAAASISKSTILLLLAVGVIGALGVKRKKKGGGSDWVRKITAWAGRPSTTANEDSKTDQP